ncbi:MAG: choice-of-anchor tandem repeat GloVer-containing protein [Candidatus Korobacteraceae bacterium]
MARYQVRAASLLFTGLFAVIVLVSPTAAQAQTYHVLYNFTGQADGGNPVGPLELDAHGNLYGMTSDYGGGNCSFGGTVGCGTAFQLARRGSGWIFSLLHTFTGGTDGQSPSGRMVFGRDGSLYGTTVFGGGGNCTFGQGCGTVFNLKPSASVCKAALCPWSETVLYRFTGGSDGNWPQLGDLVFDHSGNIYGTTPKTVYELENGTWAFNLLFAFTQQDGGCCSFSGVIFDQAGNLYGTTYAGTTGYGLVFELSPSGGGWTYNTLHNFNVETDGGEPQGDLIFDQQWNLYGTTPQGGAGDAGTVYELTPSNGYFSVLHTFYGGVGEEGPFDAVVFDANGNLYGTTYGGGSHDRGNVFKLTPSGDGWTYQDLYDFTGGSDGGTPEGKLVVDANGNLYGTTSYGGSSDCNGGCGVIFEITPN